MTKTFNVVIEIQEPTEFDENDIQLSGSHEETMFVAFEDEIPDSELAEEIRLFCIPDKVVSFKQVK